ncbi:MAG: transglutaminase family protein, partial [Verrucomicrobiota bacterium]
GNTHRAEICMDKFHNASAPNGKTGIIELRAFEAMPTAQLLANVGLFIRTVIALLVAKPFREPMKRFGPDLHDTYFLPSALFADLAAVCRELKQAGFAFDPEWLRPVLDFRFPKLGEMKLEGGSILVRQALEAWPLMAEDSSGGPTVRMVDNSTDRIEVSLSDKALLKTGRLLCNGVEVPFTTIGGKPAAGVRYKCASGYPALHPHIPVQSPLLFQWVDAKGEVQAAAKYFYWNPHGDVYKGRPKDMAEAKARRKERWRNLPARGSVHSAVKPLRSHELRATLDLRHHA